MTDPIPAAGQDPDSRMAALKAQYAAAKESGDTAEVPRLAKALQAARAAAGRVEASAGRRAAMGGESDPDDKDAADEVGGTETGEQQTAAEQAPGGDVARKTPPPGRGVSTATGKSTTVATGKRG